MSYLWKEFNIKTFPAETVVFRNGVYCPELSTLDGTDIDKRFRLPVHVIYIGEISGDHEININLGADFQPVFLSIDITTNSPAKLNVFIKNAGKNSELRGHVLLKNNNNLTFNCNAQHFCENTGILVHTKLVAGRNSLSKLSGNAIIDGAATNAVSDITFTALADRTARIEFKPAQHIHSAPKSADHGAAIYKPSDAQIQYLRSAGLSGPEVDDALHHAFMNDFDLF